MALVYGGKTLKDLTTDINTLALKEAITENRVAYNLPNSMIEQFQDDSKIGTETTGDRNASEYWETAVAGAPSITLTATGSPEINTSVKKFGAGSFKTNASGSNKYYLDSGDLDDFDTNKITGGDFTVDYWFKYISRTGSDRHFSFGNINDSTEPELSFAYNGATTTSTWGPNNADIAGTYPTQDTDWHHHAIQRDTAVSGGTCYRWLDGVDIGSPFVYNDGSSSLMQDEFSLRIGGRHTNASENFEGYIDEFRISNVKRYTNSVDFTPPTGAYTTDGNTAMLFHFDTNYADANSDPGGSSINATGTLISTAQTANAAQTKVSGVILYKNEEGTATLGTDLKIYFTCDGGSNWTESTPTAAGTFSTGILMAKCPEVTCTSGTDIRYKAVWANQSSGSKETQLHGIGMNY
jgi:hypothetical protein